VKAHTLRFRVDEKRRAYWVEAMKELGVSDFSSYSRAAIDRAIHQDLRSKDPKWQEFIKAIQSKAREILGRGISDSFQDRVENLSAIDGILYRKGTKNKSSP
jgi:hypothetical protein